MAGFDRKLSLDSDATSNKSPPHAVAIDAVEYEEIISHPSVE